MSWIQYACYGQSLKKPQKETLEIFREVGKTKNKPFLSEFHARNKQSPWGSAGNHYINSLRQHFRTQQQQRWKGNTTNQTTNKSNGKTSKTSGNYLLQHFSRTSSTRTIRISSSFSKVNFPRGIKRKCSSTRKDFPFRPISGKPHKRSGSFRNSESGKRDQRNVGGGSNRTGLATQTSPCSKSTSEKSFSCEEKRWGLPSGYKSENSESVCTLHAIKNGKFADFKIYDEGNRLHVQN